METERTKEPLPRDESFARGGLLRTARVNPVALTATQARFEADNHHDATHHNHHNHHHHRS